jgi:peptidoglycan/LPS O-acetylase OafA/YrhL
MTNRLGYQPGLDGLRAVAVSVVVAFHYGFGLPGGWLGVNLFFVISGYLITRLLIEEHADQGRIDLRAFYRRRVARLLPVLYVTAAAFGAAGLVIRPQYAAADLRGALTGLLYVANLDRYAGWADGGMFGHLWSLSLEEQFYAIWPLAFLLLARRRTSRQIGWITAAASAALFVGVVVRAAWWFDLDRLYNGIEGQGMAFLLAGCAWAALDRRGSWRGRAGPVLAAAGVLIAMATFDYATPAAYVAMPLLAAAMVVVVAGALDGGVLQPLLGSRILTAVGRRSYGIYLVHGPVRLLLIGALGWRHDNPMLLAAAVSVTLLLATASYRWVEQPLRRRLSGNRPADRNAIGAGPAPPPHPPLQIART